MDISVEEEANEIPNSLDEKASVMANCMKSGLDNIFFILEGIGHVQRCICFGQW